MKHREWSYILAVVVLFGAMLSCEMPASPTQTPQLAGDTPAPPTQGVRPIRSPEPTLGIGSGQREAPTETPVAVGPTDKPEIAPTTPPQPAAGTGGIACAVSWTNGVSCLYDGQWRDVSEQLLSRYVEDVATCPDGTLLLVDYYNGVSAIVPSGEVQRYEGAGGSSVACDPAGGFWVTHSEGVTHFDGQEWIDYPIADIITGGDTTDSPHDVAVTPDGLVYVVSYNTLSVFDGDRWQLYRDEEVADYILFSDVAVDGRGRVWILEASGLYMFDGTEWHAYPVSGLGQVSNLAVDLADHVWISSQRGVAEFDLDGEEWTGHNRSSTADGLASDWTSSVAVDGLGRVWVSTAWGVYVRDGSEWFAYRMDTVPGMVDNDIKVMGVAGVPALPPLEDQGAGSITGQIENQSKQPLGGVAVEVCVESLGVNFYGETPCDGQPFMRQTATGENGAFTFDNLPVGLYVLVARVGEGETWVKLGEITEERVPVESGGVTDLGVLTVQD